MVTLTGISLSVNETLANGKRASNSTVSKRGSPNIDPILPPVP